MRDTQRMFPLNCNLLQLCWPFDSAQTYLIWHFQKVEGCLAHSTLINLVVRFVVAIIKF